MTAKLDFPEPYAPVQVKAEWLLLIWLQTSIKVLFAVSEDGWGYNYYYCESGMACSGGAENILKECSKYSNGVDCYLFASKRTVRWKNGINPGKGKASKFSRKWSDAEIKQKLIELGFYK